MKMNMNLVEGFLDELQSKKDKLKILNWDHNGFWLFYRRL